MTIAETGSRAQYTGNGTTVAFSFPYRFFTSSDLQVYLTSAGVDTLQTSGTHYSISNTGTEAGGTVTMITAPATGVGVTILRAVPAEQNVDYQANDAFPAETHEQALDRLTLLVQQRQEETSRALRVSVATGPVGLFTPTEGAVITFNSSLDPIVGPLVGDIEDAATNATAAAASASAADASAAAAAASVIAIGGKEVKGPFGIVSNATAGDSHSLGVMPTGYDLRLVCLTAEHGFSPGDTIGMSLNNTTSSTSRINQLELTTTGFVMKTCTATNCYVARHKSTNAEVLLTNSSWQWYITLYG